MSIRNVQIERIMEDVVRTYLNNGVNPTNSQIMKIVSEYFSQFPAGLPLPLPLVENFSRQKSNPEKFNELLGHMATNLDIAYEVIQQVYNQIELMMSTFYSQLQTLQTKRKRLATKVEDYLLSQHNSEGYFFTISDNFTDTSLTDLSLTSAHIDTASDQCTLPSLSSHTKRISGDYLTLTNLNVYVDGVLNTNYREISPIAGALRSSENSFWAIEINVFKPVEITVEASFAIGFAGDTFTDAEPQVSRIEFTPYGVKPIQLFINTAGRGNSSSNPFVVFSDFGKNIQYSAKQMTFSDSARPMQTAIFTMRKSAADYTLEEDGKSLYKYILGAKEIAFIEQAYDNDAIFVSKPLRLPTSISEEAAIDAVTLVTKQEIPSETSIQYYIATDNGTQNALYDFNWIKISPLTEAVGANIPNEDGVPQNSIIRFNGANAVSKNIRSKPVGSDLQLLPLDYSHLDPAKRNPTSVMIPGQDVYRIAKFEDTALHKSLSLEEGVNTTRIYYTTLDQSAISNLTFWQRNIDTFNRRATTAPLDATSAPTIMTYGRIDIGNDFFYGGNVGRSGASVYTETYLDLQEDNKTILSEFMKNDSSSKTWDVLVLLNGREVAWLPAGTDKKLIPWVFSKGLNHIGLIINIPYATTANPNPESGSVKLMSGDQLYNYGVVKLSSWSYIDYFDLEHNTFGGDSPNTFTIKDGEIITRREPTDNFRVNYNTATNVVPNGIRLRADIARYDGNSSVTPTIKEYRIRFGYGV